MLSISTIVAQQEITLTGQLLDASTKESLPFANVTVNDESNATLITGAITDDNGRFEILGLPPGGYRLRFSFIGYTSVEQKFISGGLNTVFDLGKIELVPSTESLEEAEVIGKQSTTNAELNKKSFSLVDNIAQSGGTVLDAMKTFTKRKFFDWALNINSSWVSLKPVAILTIQGLQDPFRCKR